MGEGQIFYLNINHGHVGERRGKGRAKEYLSMTNNIINISKTGRFEQVWLV